MRRRAILRHGPSTIGSAWADLLCANVTSEGRTISGGWPGTILEARARIARHLHEELARSGLPPPRSGEIDAAATATYSRARAHWLGIERSLKVRARRDEPGDK
jgi:hypothetical protein